MPILEETRSSIVLATKMYDVTRNHDNCLINPQYVLKKIKHNPSSLELIVVKDNKLYAKFNGFKEEYPIGKFQDEYLKYLNEYTSILEEWNITGGYIKEDGKFDKYGINVKVKFLKKR